MVHFTSAFYTREEISPFARIIAIADTYYELVSVRPAVEYILAYTGELFDPTLVDMFTKIVPNHRSVEHR